MKTARAVAAGWINVEAAHRRMRELQAAIQAYGDELKTIQRILEATNSVPRRRVTLLDTLEAVMRRYPRDSWVVGDLRRALEENGLRRSSGAISATLGQALRAKSPRFTATKAGRGNARHYSLKGAAK